MKQAGLPDLIQKSPSLPELFADPPELRRGAGGTLLQAVQDVLRLENERFSPSVKADTPLCSGKIAEAVPSDLMQAGKVFPIWW